MVSTGTTGSFVAMLRACLVDGYGAKAAAGWTEEFTGTNVAAFRNSIADGGTGCYARISDNVGSSPWQVNVDVYASMSNIATGVSGASVLCFRRHMDLSWFVVADELTCYVGLESANAARRMRFMGFGDAESLSGGDAYRYFAMSMTPDDTGTNNFISSNFPSTTATGLVFGRDYTGIGSSAGHFIIGPRDAGAIGTANLPPRTSLNSADEAAMPAYAARGTVIRAKLRGLYVPLSNIYLGPQGATKSGDGFGGVGSVVSAMVSNGNNVNAGLWVEESLEW